MISCSIGINFLCVIADMILNSLANASINLTAVLGESSIHSSMAVSVFNMKCG